MRRSHPELEEKTFTIKKVECSDKFRGRECSDPVHCNGSLAGKAEEE